MAVRSLAAYKEFLSKMSKQASGANQTSFVKDSLTTLRLQTQRNGPLSLMSVQTGVIQVTI